MGNYLFSEASQGNSSFSDENINEVPFASKPLDYQNNEKYDVKTVFEVTETLPAPRPNPGNPIIEKTVQVAAPRLSDAFFGCTEYLDIKTELEKLGCIFTVHKFDEGSLVQFDIRKHTLITQTSINFTVDFRNDKMVSPSDPKTKENVPEYIISMLTDYLRIIRQSERTINFDL